LKKRKISAPKKNKSLPAKKNLERLILRQELEMFHRIIEGMRAELSYVDLLKLTVTCVCKGLGYDRAGIFLVSPDGRTIGRAIGVDAHGRFEVGHDYEDPILDKKGFSIFSDLVFGYRKFFYTSNILEKFPDVAGKVDQGVTCNANVPISVGPKRNIGVLAVDNLFSQRRLKRDDITSLANFATQAGMAIETIRLHEQVRQLSMTDELTRLYNRRYFEKFIEDELARSRRYKHPCGLLYLDLDHFKEVNDRFGHPAGDELLKYIAQFLRNELRSIDVVARLGGDEFGVILPETPASEARGVAQRLQQKFLKKEIPVEKISAVSHPVTLSIGVACFPDSADKAEDLIKLADRSLYEAKNGGRNQVGPFIKTGKRK